MKKLLGFIVVLALVMCCVGGCDYMSVKVDIDEALPHYEIHHIK